VQSEGLKERPKFKRKLAPRHSAKSTLLVVWILLFSAMALGSIGLGRASTAIMQVNNPFSLRGGNVGLNTLYYCPTCSRPWSYQPNGWDALQALNVNLIRVSGGTEGDVGHFNIQNHPNDWAQNFNDFLSQADSHGIKVAFTELGTEYGTLFGIVVPNRNPGVAGTSIADSEAMIDKLAGANQLNHNFLTDPRVIGWSIANEVDLANSATYNWCIQILDYIRSKGGKAYISSPSDSRIGSDTLGDMDFTRIEPELRGHVDYLQIHIYQVGIVVQALQKGQNVYDTMYNLFSNQIQTYMIDGRGSTPIENLIIGEFGIWRGQGTMGVTYNFAEETRNEYYKAMLQAAVDHGIKNIFNFYVFDQLSQDGIPLAPAFGVQDPNLGYFAPCASLIQQFYGSPTASTSSSTVSSSTTPTSSTQVGVTTAGVVAPSSTNTTTSSSSTSTQSTSSSTISSTTTQSSTTQTSATTASTIVSVSSTTTAQTTQGTSTLTTQSATSSAAVSTAAATTGTTAPSAAQSAVTTVSATASPSSPTVNSQVTFTATLHGSWNGLTGVVVNKQISISAWGSSGKCTTEQDGTCQVALSTPSTAGSYTVTVQFTGDSNFQQSSTSIPLTVASVSSYSIAATVNARTGTTVNVYVLQGGRAIASQKYTYTASAKTFTFTGLAAGTYTVVVQVNMMMQQSKTVTVPPNAQVTFTFQLH
jgi:hypothetical protein